MSTKRPQNKCEDCSYTWYPRGKHQSLKCPSCGGRNVSVITISWYVIFIIILLVICAICAVVFSSRTITVSTDFKNKKKDQLVENVSVANRCLSELAGKPRRDGHYISTDDADAAFIRKVSSFWVRPSSAHNGMQAELLVKILPDGKIWDVSVISSSGDTAFDLSTINAVEELSVICEILQMDPKKYAQQYKERRVIFSPEDL